MNTIKRITLILLGMMLFTISIGTAIVYADDNSSDGNTEYTEAPTWAGEDETYIDSRETVGDFDDNGVIDAADAARILTLAANMGIGFVPTSNTLYISDYNADGNADATDASLILIFAAEEGVK